MSFSPFAKVYLAGHRGLVGSALLRKLQEAGYSNLLVRTSRELDLRRQADVEAFFHQEKPEYVLLAAAKVGGIMANMETPAAFFYDNILIQSNVMHAAYKFRVNKLLYVSSSCAYPRQCIQPMKEEYLLDGKPEPTNEAYALAKICGMKMAEAYHQQHGCAFFSLIFPNIYGAGDNFDLSSSHVISALIKKMYEAKTNGLPAVEIWGTGNARREFIYVDDVADACLYFMNRLNGGEALNVGTGIDISIKGLAELIKTVVGYDGNLFYNTDKPDGMPQKLLEVSKMRESGWSPRVSLEDGLQKTFHWFINNCAKAVKGR
ncbi:MAG: GDP-L-fucose synthase [Syntrophomonadaceae bacterium]|nr:GDP-L-fucose synthase [Bacillota bacterium]